MDSVTLRGEEVESGTKVVKDGRLWLGKEYEGKRVSYAIRVIDEGEEETHEEGEEIR